MSISKKINEIHHGWKNYVAKKLKMLPKHIKAQGEERLNKCSTCNFNQGGICSPLVKDEHVHTKATVSGCGCVLKAKVLSPDSDCPAGKWDLMITEKEKYEMLFQLKNKNHVYVRIYEQPQMLYRNKETDYFTTNNGRFAINALGLINHHYKDIAKSFIIKYKTPSNVDSSLSGEAKIYAILEGMWKKLNDIQKDGIYFCILQDVPLAIKDEVSRGLLKWVAENRVKSPLVNIILDKGDMKITDTAGLYDKKLDYYDY